MPIISIQHEGVLTRAVFKSHFVDFDDSHGPSVFSNLRQGKQYDADGISVRMRHHRIPRFANTRTAKGGTPLDVVVSAKGGPPVRGGSSTVFFNMTVTKAFMVAIDL